MIMLIIMMMLDHNDSYDLNDYDDDDGQTNEKGIA